MPSPKDGFRKVERHCTMKSERVRHSCSWSAKIFLLALQKTGRILVIPTLAGKHLELLILVIQGPPRKALAGTPSNLRNILKSTEILVEQRVWCEPVSAGFPDTQGKCREPREFWVGLAG